MIVGMVRAREPMIRLAVRGFRGREQKIEAVVDTGYTGWLTLPPDVIAGLDLRWQSFGRGTLADGSLSLFDVYKAKVFWDTRLRSVFVDEFDATLLVGMALMRGCELKMEVQARGKVTIKRLPQRRR
jgi:clan AA aspartic protease